MKQGETVIGYIRVSTGRQAEFGFSLDEQRGQINRFCNSQGLTLLDLYQDSCSAKKGFKRPKFDQLLTLLINKKLKFDYLIVIKFDRFSRNLVDAIAMYYTLKSYGVKIYSLSEGEFDLSDPAKYFTTIIQQASAEHDNLMRAKTTRDGMRQAQKEGRWISTAPKGYKKDRSVRGTPMLIKNEDSILIEEGFRLFAMGAYSIDEVRRRLNQKGLVCSKNNFNNILRNVAYIGKIALKETKTEPSELITGLHEAIIDDSTFYKVQDIINGRYKRIGKRQRNEKYPLVGFLFCPVCFNNEKQHPLRASSPKGRNKNYDYYHCDTKHKCGCQSFAVEKVHSAFMAFLTSLKIKPEIASLYYQILDDVFKMDDVERDREIDMLKGQLSKLNERISNIQDDYFDRKIDIEMFNTVKSRNKLEVDKLNERLKTLSMETSSLKKYMQFGFSLFADLPKYYEEADFNLKQKLVGSIFSENLIYDGEKHRTAKPSKFIELLTNNSNGFRVNKKGQECQIKHLAQSGSPFWT
jgi:site-specific DNA recombinase